MGQGISLIEAAEKGHAPGLRWLLLAGREDVHCADKVRPLGSRSTLLLVVKDVSTLLLVVKDVFGVRM